MKNIVFILSYVSFVLMIFASCFVGAQSTSDFYLHKQQQEKFEAARLKGKSYYDQQKYQELVEYEKARALYIKNRKKVNTQSDESGPEYRDYLVKKRQAQAQYAETEKKFQSLKKSKSFETAGFDALQFGLNQSHERYELSDRALYNSEKLRKSGGFAGGGSGSSSGGSSGATFRPPTRNEFEEDMAEEDDFEPSDIPPPPPPPPSEFYDSDIPPPPPIEGADPIF